MKLTILTMLALAACEARPPTTHQGMNCAWVSDNNHATTGTCIGNGRTMQCIWSRTNETVECAPALCAPALAELPK